jgi:1,4-dihydroxy-6-naphthoate synthase
MKLTLGFSPCPNDCFIFDALVHGKIDTQDLSFDVIMEDVEALNRRAFNGELDITKLSYHSLFHLVDRYALLNSGSALGFGCGPLLVCKNDFDFEKKDPKDLIVAIPGQFTTANFLLSLAFPEIINKNELLFSEIESAVVSGKFDAGLLIHESRFTYEGKGLKKIVDLGDYWEKMISAPIPLGGIVMRRNFDKDLINKVDNLIKKSVDYAFQNRDSSMNFVRNHSQEMDESVMKRHIELYVNDYSKNLGELGWNAVNLMYRCGVEKGIINSNSFKFNGLGV